MAIPQHGSQNKFTITDTNYQNGLHKQIIATPKLIHIRSISDICELLCFSSTSLVEITVESLANLHKRPEALTRYYVTSYWQAEWVSFMGAWELKDIVWSNVRLNKSLQKEKFTFDPLTLYSLITKCKFSFIGEKSFKYHYDLSCKINSLILVTALFYRAYRYYKRF